MDVFDAYVAELSASPALAAAAAQGTRAAVKHIIQLLAKAVPQSMPRDAKHCQHVLSFVAWQQAGRKGTCKMDCAGNTCTVLALCQALTLHDAYAALGDVRLQVCLRFARACLDACACRP